MNSYKQKKLKEFDNEINTPAIAGTEGDEETCCNCGEDLSLESYDWYDKGYQDAKEDAKHFISSLIDETEKQAYERGYEKSTRDLEKRVYRDFADSIKKYPSEGLLQKKIQQAQSEMREEIKILHNNSEERSSVLQCSQEGYEYGLEDVLNYLNKTK